MQKSLTAYIVDTYARTNGLSPNTLDFQYFPPDYSESKSAEYVNIDIMGRSEPILGYKSSSQRIFRLNFIVGIDVLTPAQAPPPTVTYVDPTYGTLSTPPSAGQIAPASLSLPGYSNGISVAQADQSLSLVMQAKQNKLQFLQALLYPNYDDSGVGMIQGPPPVLIIIGTTFSMLGVVLNMELNHRAPYDLETGTPYFTDVSMTVGETANNPFSYSDVRAGKLYNISGLPVSS